MGVEPLAVEIALAFPDADATYVDRQTRLLRQELERQGITTNAVFEATPEGVRGVGELIGLVQLLLIPTLGPKLLDILQTWIANRKGSAVKLKVSRSDKTVELEFDPERIDWEDVHAMVRSLDAASSAKE